jgi:uncharacterized protein YaaQ
MLPHEVEGGNGACSTLIVGTEDAHTPTTAQRGVDEVCRSVKMLMQRGAQIIVDSNVHALVLWLR